SIQRTRDSRALLDWAFAIFTPLRPPLEPLKPIRVWFGTKTKLTPIPEYEPAVTVPLKFAASVSVELKIPRSIKAPVLSRQQVGRIIYTVAGKEYASVDVLAADSIKRGGFFRMLIDGILRFFAYIFGLV
ncbi:MAG: hypothetical protein N3A02_05860, partial [Rectinema sp.]|nr:hypothetical protein [Rectinema sp.]